MLLHKTLNESIQNRPNNVRLSMFKPKQTDHPSPSSKSYRATAILTASLALMAGGVVFAQEDRSNRKFNRCD